MKIRTEDNSHKDRWMRGGAGMIECIKDALGGEFEFDYDCLELLTEVLDQNLGVEEADAYDYSFSLDTEGNIYIHKFHTKNKTFCIYHNAITA